MTKCVIGGPALPTPAPPSEGIAIRLYDQIFHCPSFYPHPCPSQEGIAIRLYDQIFHLPQLYPPLPLPGGDRRPPFGHNH